MVGKVLPKKDTEHVPNRTLRREIKAYYASYSAPAFVLDSKQRQTYFSSVQHKSLDAAKRYRDYVEQEQDVGVRSSKFELTQCS